MRAVLPLLFGSCLLAAELRLVDGSTVDYDEMSVSASSPMAFVVLKGAGGTRSLRFSQVDLARLPEAQRVAAQASIDEQRQKRLFIVGDKWVHRDEMVLNADPRYAASGRLAKAGKGVITIDNQADHPVTIGVRSGGRGFEMHVDAGKKKGYPIPEGRLFYLIAQESEDGTRLIVRKSQEWDIKPDGKLSVTISKERVKLDDAVALDIPPEFQVR